MKKQTPFLLLLCTACLGSGTTLAQNASASSNGEVQLPADRTLSFSISDEGVAKPITWGLDLAWLSRDNIIRGMAFMGPENVDVVRSSFTPTSPLVDNELQADELATLNERLDIISLLPAETKVVLNCDHPSVSSWFVGNPVHWAELIDVTRRHHEAAGRQVITVSPFNEPDLYATGQGTIEDFRQIAAELRKNPEFDDIRISGGNTLNTDSALKFYTYLSEYLDEGNTHQLAGTFDHYAEFFQTVRNNGDHATNDELHNVMEAMVGAEYGMQTGIWWGTAEYARGEFCKASDGQRLAYTEHRPNWTAASVYRTPEGKIQAFAGASERQATTTTYRFVSKDRDVFFDGHGPLREFTLEIPGGTGYQVDQPNAERVINVTWGEDIQPVINGKYIIANRSNGKLITIKDGAANSGASIVQNSNKAAAYQQWTVAPVDSRIGGDFSYYTINSNYNGMNIDLLNWSLEEGGNVITYEVANGANQQWYLEYAGDGCFFIRSRHSSLCLEVPQSNRTDGTPLRQAEKTGESNQLWRFIPVGTRVEFTAPSAPTELTASANLSSIHLTWTASTSTDAKDYSVYRSTEAGGAYELIARGITGTSFTDNKVKAGQNYYYVVRTYDNSLNRSDYSNEASCAATGGNDLLMRLAFEGNTQDTTCNGNHGVAPASSSYAEGKNGAQSLALDGKETFVQLPAHIADQEVITLTAWVYWNGSRSGEHLFDFGDGEGRSLYLTPRASDGYMHITFQDGETEQTSMTGSLTADEWIHLALTFDASGTTLYKNGTQSFKSQRVTLIPSDYNLILNYIGRGQDSDTPLFSGKIDDVRIYNYAVSPEEIALLAENRPDALESIEEDAAGKRFIFGPSPARESLQIDYTANDEQGTTAITLYNTNGVAVKSLQTQGSCRTTLDISDLTQGTYLIQVEHGTEKIVRKFFVQE
ncbi:MAG: LamG-like jellyroll fold domain-containing protein [Bacteroidaceae bacterium]|jgi:hypothetical protein